MLTTGNRHLLLKMLEDTSLCSISCGLCPDLMGCKTIRGIVIRGTEGSVTFGYVQRRRDELSSEAEQFTEYVKKHYEFDG